MSEKINSSPELQGGWDSFVFNEDGRTRKKEYVESEMGQREVSIENEFDKRIEELDDAVKRGEISREDAAKKKEELLDSAINDIHANREGHNIGPDNIKIDDLDEDQTLAEINKVTKELQLFAINADVTHDKKELARDIAETDLNQKITSGKGRFFKRLWMGTLFKKYFQEKYTQEYLDKKRTQTIDGEELTVDDIINRRKEGAIERFIKSVIDDEDAYIHKKAGEDLKEADEETTKRVKAEIEWYASQPEDADAKDLNRDFQNRIERIKAVARDEGRKDDSSFVNNYLEVAIQARERVLHGIAMERVMDGFKVYNAEVRDGVRTEAHRDNLDKFVNKIESSKIGKFIPGEILAGAASVGLAFAQTGIRAVVGTAGGMIASSAISGLKERNRITEDRARMFRDIANGKNGRKEYGKGNGSKYEAKIYGTSYDIKRAEDLVTNIEYAMKVEHGDDRIEKILSAIAEARVRIDFSDETQKDLIAYSSEDARGKERLALDIAVIKAERLLPEKYRDSLESIKQKIREEISGRVEEKDANFKKIRNRMAAAKAGKTLALGIGAFFASQEIIAAIDPNKIGVFEKYGLLNTQNGKEAEETLLASGFGFNRGKIIPEPEIIDQCQLRGDQQVEIDRLIKDGYTMNTIEEASTELPKMPNSVKDFSPETFKNRLRIKYDGWANNGTTAFDGNELRAYLKDGQIVSGMHGVSTMGNQTFDYASLASAGKIKGYITIGDVKFELKSNLNDAGQLTWGENGIFTTTNGETIKAIGDNGEKLYKYFEIAKYNGPDVDGVEHIIPFATDVGEDSFTGTIQTLFEDPIEHPALYEFTKTVAKEAYPRDITGFGPAFAPETAREVLGRGSRRRRRMARMAAKMDRMAAQG